MRRERSSRNDAVNVMIKCIDPNIKDLVMPAVMPSEPLEQTQGESQGPDSEERYQYFGHVAASVSQSAECLTLLELENSGAQGSTPKREQFEDGHSIISKNAMFKRTV
jgi:hypothetical protein